MAKPLSILFVASEVQPFIKVGGMADVAFSFSMAMRELGHDMRVMVPKYGGISERRNRIHEINRLRDIPIPVGSHSDPATVKSSSIFNPRYKVQAYITTNLKYFDSKKGIYNDIKTGSPYPDNLERFIFFSRSVIETCLKLEWFPDIIHCNDWHTALVPAMAKVLFPKEFKKTNFVYTIHNLSNAGELPMNQWELLGMPNNVKQYFEHNKKINFTKGALLYSDYITTVSPTYAKELIADGKLSGDLNLLLKKNSKFFKGILNGLETWSWSPKTDPCIHTKLEDNFAAYKTANKQSLLSKFGLIYNENTPVIGLITRINEQKGIPLLISSLDNIMKENVQIVILGEGTLEMKNKLKDSASKYSKKIKVKFGFDEELAHLIEAGSDMFLMPSLTEPCGLNAIYSLAYGTVPIVRKTGGLSDIVSEYSTENKKGNGFVFVNFKSAELVAAVKKALTQFKSKSIWQKIVENGMSCDFTWSKSALQYDEIYHNLMKD